MFSASSLNETGLRNYILKVYATMFMGLVVSTIGASVASLPAIKNVLFHMTTHGLSLTGAGLCVVLLPLAMMFVAMFMNIKNWSEWGTNAFYYVFTFIEGIGLYGAVMSYTASSVLVAILATAGAFAFLSLIGLTTNKPLSGLASFCMMGLWGLILFPLIALIFHIAINQIFMSMISIIVFAGLTAYDSQKIKDDYLHNDNRLATWSALGLYLDFINIFLSILQITGKRDN